MAENVPGAASHSAPPRWRPATKNDVLERCRTPRRWVRGTAVVAALVGLVAAASTTAGSASVENSDVSPNSDAGPITFSMSVNPGDPVPLELITDEAAEELYDDGYRGKGIDVALVDTGVTPVNGLNQPGKIIYGPDLSNEGGFDNLANLDTYGHGTHMAGIIVGDDNELVEGIAPDSRLVSVKVAGATGETHVAQVIAGIDWVIEHKNDNGLNIRVLNLSLGAEGVKSNKGDLLSAAVERAWDAGIIVVAAVGNRGNDAEGIDTPAISPYVIAVGGTESFDSSGEKDYMGTWSSSGNKHRAPDMVAPGRSILSFRVPGSMLDQMYPQAVVKENYFKGTGTSQSAAVVSGFIAALLSGNPSLTNDQVKFLFEAFATDIAEGEYLDGSGKIDVKEVSENTRYWQKAPVQVFDYAIPAKRDDGTVGPSTASNWSGGQWNGASWSGGTWSGASWSGASWSGASWSGASWSGATWSGATWSGASWSGASWSGASWSGASWSGASWSGASWSSLNWSSASWNEFAS